MAIRAPIYGEMRALHRNHEVRKIWQSRHDEPKDLPPLDVPMVQEPVDAERVFEGREMLERALEILKHRPRLKQVLMLRLRDYTLDEIAEKLDVTKERIRQMELQCLNSIRAHLLRDAKEQEARHASIRFQREGLPC